MRYDEALINAIDCGYIRVMSYKTKRAQAIYRNYERACNNNEYCLESVYSRYSVTKGIAYERCLAIEEQYNGYGGVISSYNTFTYTYTFCVEAQSGIGTFWLVHITPSRVYAIDLWRKQEADFEQWLEERDKAELEGMEDFDELLEDED